MGEPLFAVYDGERLVCAEPTRAFAQKMAKPEHRIVAGTFVPQDGFTHADVALLRDVAMDAPRDVALRLNDVVDRLAALLPPLSPSE